MCDPDSAGLSAELHDNITCDFCCNSHLTCSKWTCASIMRDSLKEAHPRWVHLWLVERALKLLSRQ